MCVCVCEEGGRFVEFVRRRLVVYSEELVDAHSKGMKYMSMYAERPAILNRGEGFYITHATVPEPNRS